MVDSRAKRPRQVRRGRSRQRYRGACTRRPRQRRQVTPALNPTCRQKPARLRALAMSPGQFVALLVAWLAPGISRARKAQWNLLADICLPHQVHPVVGGVKADVSLKGELQAAADATVARYGKTGVTRDTRPNCVNARPLGSSRATWRTTT